MSIESGVLKEQENKKKEKSEIKEKNEKKRQLEHQKIKEEIGVEIEAEKKLDNLKELVEKGVISKETAEKVVNGIDLDDDTIKEMFEKIDEIENLKDVDTILPPELRITKDEYIKAIHDEVFRVQTITKLNSALALLANKIVPDASTGLNLFSGFLSVLDKKLILIQENTIDVKENLEEIDKKILRKRK